MSTQVTAADEWVGDRVVTTSLSSSGVGRDAWRHGKRSGWDERAGAPVGWALTSGDEGALTMLVRCGVLTWSQLKRSFYGDVRSTAARRLAYLERAGLIESDRRFERQWGKVYTATRRGCEFARQWMWFALQPYAMTGKDLTHMLAVNDVLLQLDAQGLTVVTEREIRYAERHVPGGDRDEGMGEVLAESLLGDHARSATDSEGRRRWFCVPVPGEGVHYPDAAVVREGELCAVEVELTPKEPARVRRVLRSYVRSRLFSVVFWFGTNDVQRMLRGGPRRSEGGLRWHDGIIQEMRFADPGDRQGWLLKPRSERDGSGRGMFVVGHVPLKDDGVQYEVDMKNVPPSFRLKSKPKWREKRQLWREDELLGEAAGVPFVKWLVDVDTVVNDRVEAARAHSLLADEGLDSVGSNTD